MTIQASFGTTVVRYDFKVLGVFKVVDGDTADLHVDVGFRTIVTQRIRLAVIDTPERGEVGYDRAKLFLQDWLRERVHDLRLATYGEDSFARWVGDIYDRRTGDSASAALLRADLAVVWVPR
jgi:endonuclease YncB( thermonuclease family)